MYKKTNEDYERFCKEHEIDLFDPSSTNAFLKTINKQEEEAAKRRAYESVRLLYTTICEDLGIKPEKTTINDFDELSVFMTRIYNNVGSLKKDLVLSRLDKKC